MSRRRPSAFVRCCTMAAVCACARPDATPVVDTTTDTATLPAPSSASTGSWAAELGPLLIVPADSADAGIVLFPEAPTPQLVSSGTLILLEPDGDSLATRAALVTSDVQMCGEAPIVRFPDDVASAWAVGLLARSVASLRMDSIEAMPSADSSRFAAELARLGSSLPMSAGSRFKGLPFVVLSARRFETPDRQIVAAHLVRRLPQEAAPVEEHSLVIAERPANVGKSVPYDLAYHQRSDGSEESAEHYVVLSALRGTETTLLLIARDRDTQSTYEVLERSSTGEWRLRWSRVLRC